MGETSRWGELTDFTYKAELYVDDVLIESADLPASFANRRIDLLWKYQLPKKKHKVRVKILNPNNSYVLKLSDIVIYSDGPLLSGDRRLGSGDRRLGTK
jgi:hypothetical protein